MEELRDKVDSKILPKEYGGEVPLSEMIGMMDILCMKTVI